MNIIEILEEITFEKDQLLTAIARHDITFNSLYDRPYAADLTPRNKR